MVTKQQYWPKCDWVTDAAAHGMCDAPAVAYLVAPSGPFKGCKAWVCSLHVAQGQREGGRLCACRDQAERTRH